MKISQLPEDIKKLALEYQKNEVDNDFDKSTDNLLLAFNWERTAQGHDFWDEWDNKEFNPLPTEDLKINTVVLNDIVYDTGLTISLKTTEDTFIIRIDGYCSSISKEEAKRLIEFLQAQI